MIKKLISVAASLVVLSSLTLPAVGADLPDEQWSLPTANIPSGSEHQGILIQENLQIAENTSVLGGNLSGNNDQTQVRYCASVDDEFCTVVKSMFFDAILPKCGSDTANNCIAGVTAISSSGQEINGTYVRNFPDAGFTDFPASPTRNLPQGSSPS